MMAAVSVSTFIISIFFFFFKHCRVVDNIFEFD